MSHGKITLLNAGTDASDAVNKGQMDTADNLRLSLSGGTMSGNLNMGTSHKIINLHAGDSDLDAVNFLQMETADNLRLKLDGTTPMTNNLNMGTTHKIINLLAGDSGTDAVNFSQMETADNLRLKLDGSTAMTNNLNMGSTHKIINLLAGDSGTDAVNFSQMETADNLRLKLDGSTPMTNDLNMGLTTNKITNLTAGAGPLEAVNFSQMDTADNLRVLKTGDTMSGQLNMGNSRIGNLSPAVSNLDAVNYQQIATGSIPRTTYNSGEIVKITCISSTVNSGLFTPNNTVKISQANPKLRITNQQKAVVINATNNIGYFNYTAQSNTYICVEVNWLYIIDGLGTDEFAAFIYSSSSSINSTTPFISTTNYINRGKTSQAFSATSLTLNGNAQTFTNVGGGGTRSGVLFPMMFSFIPIAGIQQYYYLCFDASASDDSITFDSDVYQVKITEIKI
jgi:hypothetical protein